MRSALIGLVCLVVGVLGALGYSHYLGEGKQLADVQDELAKSRTSLTKAAEETKRAKDESTAFSEQVQQLTATKTDLQKQLDAAKSPAPAAPAPASPFANMGGMMKGMLAQKSAARLKMLVARLHLSPQQEAALKAAMDEQDKMAEEQTNKMFSGGKIDPQAMADMKAHTSVEKTLDQILDPQQKTEYQQVKTDEKNSAAEMMASVEMNQMGTSLQLSDTQKDQVYNALAQVQLQSQDPNWIKQNNVSAANPASVLDAQEQAKEDALSKILSPDQMATYRQQAQSQIAMQKAMIQKFMPQAGGGAGTAAPAAAAPASQ